MAVVHHRVAQHQAPSLQIAVARIQAVTIQEVVLREQALPVEANQVQVVYLAVASLHPPDQRAILQEVVHLDQAKVFPEANRLPVRVADQRVLSVTPEEADDFFEKKSVAHHQTADFLLKFVWWALLLRFEAGN